MRESKSLDIFPHKRNHNKDLKLVEMIQLRFRSRVCSHSLVKEMAIKNELTLYSFFLSIPLPGKEE